MHELATKVQFVFGGVVIDVCKYIGALSIVIAATYIIEVEMIDAGPIAYHVEHNRIKKIYCWKWKWVIGPMYHLSKLTHFICTSHMFDLPFYSTSNL